MARSNKKLVITVLILLVLLIAALVYIGYGVYTAKVVANQQANMIQGAQLGYEQAIAQIFQGAGACQQVPITYNNQTINIIAVECLQQAA